MGAPLFPRQTVEDAMAALMEAADRLEHVRTEGARLADALDARWAANRAMRGHPPQN